jgi:hypothetical protein
MIKLPYRQALWAHCWTKGVGEVRVGTVCEAYAPTSATFMGLQLQHTINYVCLKTLEQTHMRLNSVGPTFKGQDVLPLKDGTDP